VEAIGPYRIVRQIGEGGMGIVFEARDERLDRSVAVKTIRHAVDASTRERFVREARAAAAISHPNICQIFEIGEHAGAPYLVMELLDGQPLAERLVDGPLSVTEALDTILPVLAALQALHRRGVIHRDLKPSNIFLTSYGVKLLDFGLARPAGGVDDTALTVPGTLLGTPRYMAPEQARGAAIDPRADIFAAGAVLFEMLSGRPAFPGTSAIDVLHAVIYDHPPALVGSAAIAEIDRIIHRALAKTPDERYTSSDTMASELRACLARSETGVTATVTATRRLIVLPFRNLRPDPDTEFLAFSLPDAITVALSGLESLVIRSTLVAARYTATDIDPRALASDAAVDAVVMGTLLRAHNQVRVTVQLVEVPAGTLLWSQAMEVPIEDLFQIQDRVARAVVTALSVPMSSTERRQLQHDIPANPDAYGLYLRANRLMDSASRWQDALTFYRQAVELDPRYAPAWARLGRCLRLLGKYGSGVDAAEHVQEAKAAFARAFDLNPDLSLAHNLYTYAEVENGRAQDAMTRLLGRLQSRSSDPELYAGLVHACRYCGLLGASIAADAHARRLDPGIVTSVVHSYFMKGDFEKAIAHDTDNPPYLTLLALTFSGRRAEALAIASGLEASRIRNQKMRLLVSALQAMLENRVQDTVEAVEQLEDPSFTDPEGWFYWAHLMAGLGHLDSAVSFLDRTVAGGWACTNALERSPGLEAVQSHPLFAPILARARRAEAEAAHAFAAADGPRLLGFAIATSRG
jgi:eukaryotic-like serine/threonine-protein kinase